MQPNACSEVDNHSRDRNASPVKLSRPQKRRRRMQILAASKAMSLQSVCEKGGEQTDRKSQSVDISDQLDRLESLMQQVCLMVSQQTLPNWESCTNELATAACLYQSLHAHDTLNPNVPEFVPGTTWYPKNLHFEAATQPSSLYEGSGEEALPKDSATYPQYCLWAPGSKVFIKGRSLLEAELQHEAAVILQRHFRNVLSNAAGVDGSSECSEVPSVCAECRESFAESQLEDGYPDRCDICSAFRHRGCLVECSNSRGGVECLLKMSVGARPADGPIQA